MAKCPACRYSWREMEDERSTECPSCGYTGRCGECGTHIPRRALRDEDYECSACALLVELAEIADNPDARD